MEEINPSSTAQGQNDCNGLECCTVKHSSETSPTPTQRREHRYKNMLHLWEFLLELLADESCRSIICWRKKGSGEFKLIDHHEVAKRWGIFKQKEGMNYSKLSRALRLYYHQGIIRKVKGQMLVYKFYKLPYKYEPGVTRSAYQEHKRKNAGLHHPESQKAKPLPPPIFPGSLTATSAVFPTRAPLGKCFSWPVGPMPSPGVGWCPEPVLCTCASSVCYSKSRIFCPVLLHSELFGSQLSEPDYWNKTNPLIHSFRSYNHLAHHHKQ